MEIDHRQIQEAGSGAEVALKVDDRVHKGDTVYRLLEPSSEEIGFGLR